MSKKYFQKQCNLEKKIPTGVLRQVSWIPENFAIVGRYVKLKEGDVWEDGWKVASVGARRSSDEAIARGRDYLKQRDSSDV